MQKYQTNNKKEEWIIDPVISTFVKLDDISIQLDDLLDLQVQNQKILNLLAKKELELELELELEKGKEKLISKSNNKDQKLLQKFPTQQLQSNPDCIPPDCNFSLDIQTKTLDDISRQFTELIEVTKANQTTLNSISNQTSIASDGINKSVDLIGKNQMSLDKIFEANNNMTNQFDKLLDEGGNITIQGIATSTEFTIINTIDSPGHPVKGMVVKNSCDSTIFVGVNVAESTVGPDIIDTITDNSRFTQVLSDENFPMSYNTQSIKNIWILSKKIAGKDTTAKFRCLLTW